VVKTEYVTFLISSFSKFHNSFSRRGRKIKEVTLPIKARVKQLEWDKDNEMICILQVIKRINV